MRVLGTPHEEVLVFFDAGASPSKILIASSAAAFFSGSVSMLGCDSVGRWAGIPRSRDSSFLEASVGLGELLGVGILTLHTAGDIRQIWGNHRLLCPLHKGTPVF